MSQGKPCKHCDWQPFAWKIFIPKVQLRAHMYAVHPGKPIK